MLCLSSNASDSEPEGELTTKIHITNWNDILIVKIYHVTWKYSHRGQMSNIILEINDTLQPY